MRTRIYMLHAFVMLGCFFGLMQTAQCQFNVSGYYPDATVANLYHVVGAGLSQVTKMTYSTYIPQGDAATNLNFNVVSDQEITFSLSGSLSTYVYLTFSNPNYSVIGITLVNTGGRYNMPLITVQNGQAVQSRAGSQRVLVLTGGSFGGGGSTVSFIQNGGIFTGNTGGGSNTTYFEPYAYGSNSNGGGGGNNYIEVNSIVLLPQIDPSTIISGSSGSTNTVTLTGGTTVTGPNGVGYGLLNLSATGTTTLFDYVGNTGTLTSLYIQIAQGGAAIIRNSGNGVLTLPPINENGGTLTLTKGRFVAQAITGAAGSDPIIDDTIVGFTAANSYTGPTSITHGSTLLTGTAGALPLATNSDVTLGESNDGGAGETNNLDLLGTSQTVASLKNTGPDINQVVSSNGSATTATTGSSASTTTGTLTVNYSGATVDTYSGNLGSGSETAFSVTKAGTGTLVLSGANVYSGATSVTGGTLALTSNLTTTSGVTVGATGTLTLSGAQLATSGTVINNGSLVLGSGALLSSTGPIINNGTLDVRNDPTFALPANLINKGTVLEPNGITLVADDSESGPTMPWYGLVCLGALLLAVGGRRLAGSNL